jgi:transcription initiation factor TFIIH subunit 2
LITERTGGRFGVAMNEQHYRELIFESVQAPATTGTSSVAALGIRSALDRAQKAQAGAGKAPPCDLMMMGFPTRLPARSKLSLCACHGQLKQGGYLCPRCGSKLCEVPTDCEICGLMVVSSPHLARR